MGFWIASVVMVVASFAIPVSVRLCATGRVGANPIMGIRTRYLMASPEAWKVGHRAAFPAVAVGSAVSLIAALISFDLDLPQPTRSALILGAGIALVAGMVIGLIPANRAALDHIAADQGD